MAELYVWIEPYLTLSGAGLWVWLVIRMVRRIHDLPARLAWALWGGVAPRRTMRRRQTRTEYLAAPSSADWSTPGRRDRYRAVQVTDEWDETPPLAVSPRQGSDSATVAERKRPSTAAMAHHEADGISTETRTGDVVPLDGDWSGDRDGRARPRRWRQRANSGDAE